MMHFVTIVQSRGIGNTRSNEYQHRYSIETLYSITHAWIEAEYTINVEIHLTPVGGLYCPECGETH